MAHPGLPSEDADGLTVPGWLRFSANHMWLDVTDDGACHAGIDAFLCRVLGPIDRVTYVWQKGLHHPTAILTAAGVDVEIVFPNPLILTGCNLYLRANPSRISQEPYTGGWLFEGKPAPETLDNLIQGAEAQAWMEQEQRRMSEYLQQADRSNGTACLADGGLFVPGIAQRLDRERALALVHEFFSPYASRKREP
jgi:glycine cleavage system H lipoate-binding protein